MFDQVLKKHDEKFFIRLTEYGLEIGNNQGLKLCCEKDEVSVSSFQPVLWVDPSHPTYFNQKAGYWQLIKIESENTSTSEVGNEEDCFMIGMNYGDTPRIVARPKDPKSQQQNIIVSTRWRDNIYKPEFAHWKLEIVQNSK